MFMWLCYLLPLSTDASTDLARRLHVLLLASTPSSYICIVFFRFFFFFFFYSVLFKGFTYRRARRQCMHGRKL